MLSVRADIVFAASTASLLAAAMLGMGLIAHEDGASAAYDPLDKARRLRGQVSNLEAPIPPQCYTKTQGFSNPCWTCHTVPVDPNFMKDDHLQEEYAFSDFGLTNRWSNLFEDRSARIEEISDEEILEYIREDNSAALSEALREDPTYAGYIPDLDFVRGFGHDGFALDGSGWRAIRFKPFLGTFWPTNGNRNDVAIRLPAPFRQDADGNESLDVYKVNLAILEAATTSHSRLLAGPIDRVVEPIDESPAGVDLDGDGDVGGIIVRITVLPERYVGGAHDVKVERNLFPQNTEFLHTVRYVDPDAPDLAASRMKEIRYGRKARFMDLWARQWAYERDGNSRDEGFLPQFKGSSAAGIRGDFGWSYQGFIEDEQGRLRLQTDEEIRSCMGCHGAIGVTVDHSFAFSRKVPGIRGWGYQRTRGIPDVPQVGHDRPETLVYLERVKGGDEFRANNEMIDRWFVDGEVNEALVRRAAVGGDADLRMLIEPSRERALLLNKAYKALVEDNDFEHGRDGVIHPVQNVFDVIAGNVTTDLGASGLLFSDGRLHLDWTGVAAIPGDVNADGAVDEWDTALIRSCISDPRAASPVLLDAADIDRDGDVDTDDVDLQEIWMTRSLSR